MSIPLALRGDLGIPSCLTISYHPQPRRTLRPSFIPQAALPQSPGKFTGDNAASKRKGTSENVAPSKAEQLQANQSSSSIDIQKWNVRAVTPHERRNGVYPSMGEFEAELTELFIIMPFLHPRLSRIRREVLAHLAYDVNKTASRLIELKTMIPKANIESICSRRPSTLLDRDWEKVPSAVESLALYYDETTIARMVTAEPALLVEDVNKILKELEE